MSLGYVGFTAAAQLRELDVALQIAAGAIIIVLVAWILYRKIKRGRVAPSPFSAGRNTVI